MKPFLVTVEFEFACVSENEEDAKSFIRDAMDDLRMPDLEADCIVSPLTCPPAGWDIDCLVYHDGTNDITVKEALKLNELND